MEEQCYALLIDADNVSAKYIKPILTELSKYGIITYKRIYGDWTSTQHSSWKDELLTNSITPIQQFSYTQGKNSTDSAMIIDAMDILYTNDVDGFCIVSSDSDFTRLVSRLRESGKMVIGMGENKTPQELDFERKHEAVSSVLVEGKERKGAVPAAPEQTVVVSQNPALTEATAVEEKPVNSSLEGSTSGTQKSSISTSPDRAVSLPAKKEEEKKKATPVISSVYRSFLME